MGSYPAHHPVRVNPAGRAIDGTWSGSGPAHEPAGHPVHHHVGPPLGPLPHEHRGLLLLEGTPVPEKVLPVARQPPVQTYVGRGVQPHQASDRGVTLRIARSRAIIRLKRHSRVELHANPYCDRTVVGNWPAASSERMGEIALRPNKPPNGVSNAEATVRACALTTMVSAAQLRSTVARNAFHVRGTASV